MHQQQTVLKTLWEKKKLLITSNFFFSTMFLLNQRIVSPFVNIYDISLFAAELEEPEIGMWGKGLSKIISCKTLFCHEMLHFHCIVKSQLSYIWSWLLFSNIWERNIEQYIHSDIVIKISTKVGRIDNCWALNVRQLVILKTKSDIFYIQQHFVHILLSLNIWRRRERYMASFKWNRLFNLVWYGLAVMWCHDWCWLFHETWQLSAEK